MEKRHSHVIMWGNSLKCLLNDKFNFCVNITAEDFSFAVFFEKIFALKMFV